MTTEYKPLHLSMEWKVPKFFVPQVTEAVRQAQREMELSLSISLKRGMFGGGTGEPLTPEEEEFSKVLEERAEWYETHCPECGRPYNDTL